MTRYLIEGDVPSLTTSIRQAGSILASILVISTFVVQAYFIPRDTADIFSTLLEGDRIVVTKTDYLVVAPKRGELVQFRLPSWGELISRVIALPGELVEIDEGTVRINGEALHESYVLVRPSYSFHGRVPHDCYFVLPDRRAGATVLTAGSQHWGFVRRKDFVGRVRFVYWPLRRIGSVPIPSY
jgi:signal peptidase I